MIFLHHGTRFFAVALCYTLALLTFCISSAHAQQECASPNRLTHSFSSGAAWSLCVDVSESQGLSITDVRYRAPGDTERSVLSNASAAQILVHYHDSSMPDAQLWKSDVADPSITSPIVTLSNQHCDGDRVDTPSAASSICSRVINNHVLAKYSLRPSVQSQAWELSSLLMRSSLTWITSWTLTEDGQIRPHIGLSGRTHRINDDGDFAQQIRSDIPKSTRATILATWRIEPALDSDAPDSVEQFDFPLNTDGRNRRPMVITPIQSEYFANVKRDAFRGWRILDATGAGYYLDPANNGFSYTSNASDWSQYDIAITAYNPCEKYASHNRRNTDVANCGDSLDSFVNGQSLDDKRPVLWYSQTRLLDPGVEDWPIISELSLGFELLPFDWTETSPFEVIE